MVKCKLESRAHYAQTVGDATAKIDGRRLFKILGWTRHFADAKSEVYTLREHLVVEHKVRRIFQQRQLGQDFAAERPIAGVILRELYAQKQVLEGCQKAVGDVLVQRHAAMQRLTAYDSRPQHHVVHVVSHHAGQGRDEQWRVLIIRVDHDHDIGACREGFPIAGLLVPAVAKVAVVLEHRQSQLPGQCRGFVFAVIVHQDAYIHQFGDLPHSRFQRALRVVGRHYHRDPFTVDHLGSLDGYLAISGTSYRACWG